MLTQPNSEEINMNPKLLDYLCDPIDKSEFRLENPVFASNGHIEEGILVSLSSDRKYPIKDRIPRFAEISDLKQGVESFGNEWNYFNFDLFKLNWLNHTVKNSFGSIDVFRDKIIVDAGGGSGMQTQWMAQAGAEYVICLELSHSVDGIMKKNLNGLENVDIVQCSIDKPPLKDNSIKGMVICHNVIQHTPSVEKTARELWKIVGKGGEFVFNCYPKNDQGFLRKIRFYIYLGLRKFLSKQSFTFLLNYSKVMSILRFIPLVGLILEKAGFMVRGDVSLGPRLLMRLFKSGVLNTFDCYGSHQFQHLKSEEEIKSLVQELQPNCDKVLNVDRYFQRPAPIGCALRIFK